MLIVDTREQKPLWKPGVHNVRYQKLDEGDYTLDELLGIAHIERKSGIDLYGSIIQNHARFRAEILRAKEKGINLAVFVECPKEVFIAKKFKGGYRLHAKPAALRKIISTIEEKYNLPFIWCKDRNDLRNEAVKWFQNQRRLIKHAKTTDDKKS